MTFAAARWLASAANLPQPGVGPRSFLMALPNTRPAHAEAALVGLAFAFFALAGSQGEARPLIVYPLLLSWPLAVLALWFTRQPLVAIGYLFSLGLLIRLAYLAERRFGSDVLNVTWEAVDVTLHGGNPYTHSYTQSLTPTENPFAYPPGNLLYYSPGFLLGDIRATEIFSSAIVLTGLGWAAWMTRNDWPVAAMGVYAAAPPLIALATDNSNDTSAGALLFAAAFALLLAKRWSSGWLLVGAGLLMGEAIAFKHYVFPFWPFFVAYLASLSWHLSWPAAVGRAFKAPAWLVYAAVSGGYAALITLPFFLASPEGFVDSIMTFSSRTAHPIAGWNVWAFLGSWRGWDADQALGNSLNLINASLMAATIGIGLLLRVRRPSSALLLGAAAWFAAIFFARWTTYAYFAGIAPAVLLIPFADQLAGVSTGRAEPPPENEAGLATRAEDSGVAG